MSLRFVVHFLSPVYKALRLTNFIFGARSVICNKRDIKILIIKSGRPAMIGTSGNAILDAPILINILYSVAGACYVVPF